MTSKWNRSHTDKIISYWLHVNNLIKSYRKGKDFKCYLPLKTRKALKSAIWNVTYELAGARPALPYNYKIIQSIE